MRSPRAIVVVGASLAGLRAVEALRAQGYDGRLTLIGAEPHAPYDRPPLSKELLRGEWGPERIALRRDGFAGLDVDLRLGRCAVELRPHDRAVVLDDGARVAFDGAVLATGAVPRRLAGGGELAGVHVLRSLDDALALRADLERGPRRVTVVGAGFIGLEVAASCRARGLEVTVVEPQAAPLASILGGAMGEVCADLHRDHGVDLRTGIAVTAIEGRGRVERVVLGDGTAVASDVVVVGIGVMPATAWLAGSGVEVADGVVCNQRCETSVDGVVAAGDVARWYNALFAESMRVEHWTNAAEQGVAAARALLHGAAAPAFAPVPTFWSDQYEIKIQFAGRAPAGAEVTVVAGTPGERRFVALYGWGERLVGVLAFRRAAQFARYTDLIGRRVPWNEALAAARGSA